MWKSLLLGLLVSLHTRIFLVFMRNYEAKSPLFMIKRAGLNYVPRQSYSKNSHGSYILKWILVFIHFIRLFIMMISVIFELRNSYNARFILCVLLTEVLHNEFAQTSSACVPSSFNWKIDVSRFRLNKS